MTKRPHFVENRTEIGFPCGFPFGFPRAHAGAPRETDGGPAIRQRTARKSVLCTVLWTVLYFAGTQLPNGRTTCEKKIPQKWTRASTSKGRERPPVLGRAAAPALRASGVAPALRVLQNVVRAVLPASIGTNPNHPPQRFYPPSKCSFLRLIS